MNFLDHVTQLAVNNPLAFYFKLSHKVKKISVFKLYNFVLGESLCDDDTIIHNTVCVILNVAMLRMSGAIQQSTDVMKAMRSLISVPEIQGAMMELSREMEKVCRLCSLMVHTKYIQDLIFVSKREETLLDKTFHSLTFLKEERRQQF